jgi:acrylyl-CoA reductase (NADPH)
MFKNCPAVSNKRPNDIAMLSRKSNPIHSDTNKLQGREALEATRKPIFRPEYAHAIDTVGGTPLSEVLKRIAPGGSVATCGNAAGISLETTVLPFILRGVSLLGVDSVEIPLEEKRRMWTKLATDWRCPVTEKSVGEIGRHELKGCLDAMLQGTSSGRVVLDHSRTE